MSKFRYIFITNQFTRLCLFIFNSIIEKDIFYKEKTFCTWIERISKMFFNILEKCFSWVCDLETAIPILIKTFTELFLVFWTQQLYGKWIVQPTHWPPSNRPLTTYSPTQRLLDPPNTNPLIDEPNTHPHKRQYSTKETWQ